jgi:hypothetical protein
MTAAPSQAGRSITPIMIVENKRNVQAMPGLGCTSLEGTGGIRDNDGLKAFLYPQPGN